MCGIAGVVRPTARPEDGDALDGMLAALVHRGPDGEGRHAADGVTMGMRRLAVLDVAHGQQPFHSADGRVAVVMNGEIYNFRALRKELAARGIVFHTDCDAEVVPHAYREWGVDGMLDRLDGMFALAIHDRAAGRLHLCRDRFGEKPLFYAAKPGGLAFASELAALCVLPDVASDVDPAALRQYLALHFVTGPRTILRDVRRVPPGHRMEVDPSSPGDLRIVEWWRVEDAVPRRPPRGEAAVRWVGERLRESVRSRLVADVPVGVFLSGGVDSSAVAALAGPGVRTFSIGFEDAALDESEHARRVAAHLGSEHHHFTFDLAACLDTLEPALASAAEPLGDPACLPVHLLAREARRHVTVVLSGEGADEMFGGYGYYPRPDAPVAPPWLRAARAGWRALRGTARARTARVERGPFYRADHTTASGFPMLTARETRDELVPGDVTDADPWLDGVAERVAASGLDALGRAQLADVLTWLPDDLLPKLDRMTMAASLEARAPFLEHRLAAGALGLDAAVKGGGADGRPRKWVLREAVSGALPAPILARPKQGFVLPLSEWLVGPLEERLLDELDGDLGDGLDAKRARDLALADLAEGAGRSRLLFALLAYRIWFRRLRARSTG